MIGNYKVLKVLGEGGFGTTYLAEHQLLKKKVVVKQSHFSSQIARNIMLNEAGLLWDVNHWALPTVKDVLQDESGDLVLVMSFIEGEELNNFVRTIGPLDLETVCWVSQRILSALYYLHFSGIVHRDVKPANIIVNFQTHIATLVDFGLSKLKPDGQPDPSGYTPLFASPEQIAGKAPIPESDIYSLGITMIHIIGGDIQTKSMPATVPAEFQSFVQAMIRQDPRQRPSDCKALNTELSKLREQLFQRKHTI